MYDLATLRVPQTVSIRLRVTTRGCVVSAQDMCCDMPYVFNNNKHKYYTMFPISWFSH